MTKGFRVDDIVKVVKEGSSFWGREATVRMGTRTQYCCYFFFHDLIHQESALLVPCHLSYVCTDRFYGRQAYVKQLLNVCQSPGCSCCLVLVQYNR
jgi:hypothetical protein